jgi:hypothetical protein
MVEKDETIRLNPVVEETEEVEVPEEDDNDGAGKGFKWKVAANTHYLWSTSAGGATRMNVDFGKKAPPSAAKKVKVDISTGKEVDGGADASQHHQYKPVITKKKVPKPALRRVESRTSIVGVSVLDVDDLKGRVGLANELSQVMTQAQAADQALEQLDDESDFKIEYAFEEVEVGQGENLEETLEEEFIDDSGVVVGRFAVPVGRFWLVALGMIGSTVLLTLCLTVLLRTSDMYASRDEAPSEADIGLDVPMTAKKTQLQDVTELAASGKFFTEPMSRSSWIADPRANEISTLKDVSPMTMDTAWQKLRGASSIGHQDELQRFHNS